MKKTKQPIQPCNSGKIVLQRIIKKGFTLIELLVVIAIIGILITISLPSLNKAKILARRTACAGNLRSVGIGFRMYLNNSDDVMPYAAQMPSLELNDYPRIVDVLARWAEEPTAFQCPADIESRPDTGQTYFESEGSSFEYHTMHSGRKVGEGFLTRRLGPAKVPIMNDYETFHGKPGTYGSTNYLFADCHIGDLVDKDVEIEMEEAEK